MTTRRGFIHGIFAAIGAAVMPKVAAAEVVPPSVNHRMRHAIDELMAAEEAVLDESGDRLNKMAAEAMEFQDSVGIVDLPNTLFGMPIVYSSIVPGDEVYLMPLCSVADYCDWFGSGGLKAVWPE